ncbi:MAG: hypothetical protein COB26_00445 [Piscirickettsiaceae bacterium]|nr:MAG: hypothetical protein COB26_06880 [Piscirickettsiaceae bacterium]PCI72195.1 MAG: hypothetical protein COB26_00445 [Piscirickettsiaceae bacterium]
MIEETAEVLAVSGHEVTVKTIKQSACGGCKEADTCSTSVLSKYFGNKSIELSLTTALPVKIGDSVTVGLEEQALLRLTALIYLLPMLVMFVCAMLGSYIEQTLQMESELLTIVFALTGLLATFFTLRRYSTYWFDVNKLNPTVLKIN